MMKNIVLLIVCTQSAFWNPWGRGLEEEEKLLSEQDPETQKAFWDKYHTFKELEKYWAELAGQGVIERDVLVEKTENNNPVHIVTIKGEKDGGELIEILIDCAQHAREYSAAQTCPYLAFHWLQNPELIKGFKVYIVPMMNPDGYIYSHDDPNQDFNDPSNEHRMWRKNRQKVADNPTDELGIDENRSWPVNFHNSGENELLPEHNKQQTWAGKKPLESIEDKNFVAWTDNKKYGKQKSHIKFHLDVHGSTKPYWIIGYPPNVTDTVKRAAEHKEDLSSISKAMITVLPGYGSSDIDKAPQQGDTPDILYDAGGTIGDTMVKQENIVCSFLMEIPGDEHFDPIGPISDIVKNAAKAIDVALVKVKTGICDRAQDDPTPAPNPMEDPVTAPLDQVLNF